MPSVHYIFHEEEDVEQLIAQAMLWGCHLRSQFEYRVHYYVEWVRVMTKEREPGKREGVDHEILILVIKNQFSIACVVVFVIRCCLAIWNKSWEFAYPLNVYRLSCHLFLHHTSCYPVPYHLPRRRILHNILLPLPHYRQVVYLRYCLLRYSLYLKMRREQRCTAAVLKDYIRDRAGISGEHNTPTAALMNIPH
jgi:hypothetical protein